MVSNGSVEVVFVTSAILSKPTLQYFIQLKKNASGFSFLFCTSISRFHTKTYSEFLNPALEMRELFIPKLNLACADNQLCDILQYLNVSLSVMRQNTSTFRHLSFLKTESHNFVHWEFENNNCSSDWGIRII